MNKPLLFSCFLFLAFCSYSQTDTIRIQKKQSLTYKCENKSAKSWYVHIDGNRCILADLTINPNEIGEWFQKFSSSQNIYKADYIGIEQKKIEFKKPNDPLDTLIFTIIENNKEYIKLQSEAHNELFIFRLLEI